MFSNEQLAILELLKTPSVKSLFAQYGDSIALNKITTQEREVLAPYYLTQLAFLYDDIELAKGEKFIGYSKRKTVKLILERIKRHRQERDSIAVDEGFAAYLPLLQCYDREIDKTLLPMIEQCAEELVRR